MQRIRDTGHASAVGTATVFDPVKNGKDLPSLVAWLIRSGLTFAPAPPGDESTYRTVFTQMRDLYTRVAAEISVAFRSANVPFLRSFAERQTTINDRVMASIASFEPSKGKLRGGQLAGSLSGIIVRTW